MGMVHGGSPAPECEVEKVGAVPNGARRIVSPFLS